MGDAKTYPLGGSSFIKIAPAFKDIDTKTLSGEDDSHVKMLKAQARSSLVAPFKQEKDLAMATLDPVAFLNTRFAARESSIKGAITSIDKMIDEGVMAGLSIAQLQQLAAQATGAFASIANVGANIAAPSALASVAWGAETGAKPKAPKAKARRKKPTERKTKSKRK